MTAVVVPGGVLAIDAGNSKTDIALVGPDGSVLARARGGGFHPHLRGATAAVADLAPVVAAVASAAGLSVPAGVPLTQHVSACLANADLPIEERQLQAAIESHGWAVSVAVANDTFALLRAGVEEPKGVVVVCGAGINCAGLRPDGRSARFPAVGRISGDWGGGMGLADEALWHAARADDGRGPWTALAEALPAHYGLGSMPELIEALHLGDISMHRRLELTPVLFEVAAAGDEIAYAVVRRQAEEIVTMARVALDRLDLLDEPADLVFGGGVLTAGHPQLLEAIAELLAVAAPKAVTRVVRTPPVLGAALLGLDHLEATPEAQSHLRTAFT